MTYKETKQQFQFHKGTIRTTVTQLKYVGVDDISIP